jgi:hypothetical protein
LQKFDLKTYAQPGAEARVRELKAELEAIYRVFPVLRRGGKSPAAPSDTPAAKAPSKAATRRRRTMSATEKKAVSARMKKYWAARRKAAEK